MDWIVEWIMEYSPFFIVGLVSIWLITFILLWINMSKTKKMQQKYELFMGGSHHQHIESMLLEFIEKTNKVMEEQENIEKQCKKLESNLRQCIQKVGIVRYNPFEEMGGNLCFAIALLDDLDNGVILNGLHSREGSYTYGKPIENGKSKFILSAEETQALDIAKRKGYHPAIK